MGEQRYAGAEGRTNIHAHAGRGRGEAEVNESECHNTDTTNACIWTLYIYLEATTIKWVMWR